MNRRTFLSAAIAAALTPKMPAPARVITFPAPLGQAKVTEVFLGTMWVECLGRPVTVTGSYPEFKAGDYITVEV